MARTDNIGPNEEGSHPEAPEGVDSSPILTESGARSRDPLGTVRDGLYVSPERLASLGLTNVVLSCQVDAEMNAKSGDDGKGTNAKDRTVHVEGQRVLCAIRDHRHSNRYEACESDRYWQVRDKYPSAEVVDMKGGGRSFGHHDLIYVTVDRAEYEQKRREEQATAQQFYEDFKRGNVPGAAEVPGGIDPAQGPQKLEESKAYISSVFQGLRTNWPKEMDLEDIERFQGADRTLEIERRAAMGSRGERPGERERWSKFREERAKAVREEAKSRGKNRTYSFAGSPTR